MVFDRIEEKNQRANQGRTEGMRHQWRNENRGSTKSRKRGCEGCGIRVAFCPQSVLELDERENGVATRLEDCICGLLCQMHCTALIIVSAGSYPFVLRYRSTNEARSPFDTSGRTGIHRAVAETIIKAHCTDLTPGNSSTGLRSINRRNLLRKTRNVSVFCHSGFRRNDVFG